MGSKFTHDRWWKSQLRVVIIAGWRGHLLARLPIYRTKKTCGAKCSFALVPLPIRHRPGAVAGWQGHCKNFEYISLIPFVLSYRNSYS